MPQRCTPSDCEYNFQRESGSVVNIIVKNSILLGNIPSVAWDNLDGAYLRFPNDYLGFQKTRTEKIATKNSATSKNANSREEESTM